MPNDPRPLPKLTDPNADMRALRDSIARDDFAASALTGLLSRSPANSTSPELAAAAYRYADAMMAERKRA